MTRNPSVIIDCWKLVYCGDNDDLHDAVQAAFSDSTRLDGELELHVEDCKNLWTVSLGGRTRLLVMLYGVGWIEVSLITQSKSGREKILSEMFALTAFRTLGLNPISPRDLPQATKIGPALRFCQVGIETR
jgi:hypothetical protein